MKASFWHLTWMWVLCCDVSGQTGTYTVKPGDSLSKIARGQGCSVEALAKANGIKLSAIIQPGQILKVPGSAVSATVDGSHIIQPGDTFSSISRQYGVPLESLMAANPGLNPKTLKPGQKVLLAGASKPPAADPSPSSPTPVADTESSPAPTVANPDTTPSATPDELPPGATPQAPERQVRTVMVDTEMTFGEFAKQHGISIQQLNELNGLDLTESMVLAKGSELYVPTQP